MIDELREKFESNQFEFSRHAVDQMVVRRILVSEVREAVASGMIIEDYPHDKYGPSCLLLGETRVGRPLHVHCSYPARPMLKIITVYEPDPELWDNMMYRKSR